LPINDIGSYVVFGLNSVWMQLTSDIYSGSIGAQSASAGPMLDSNAEVSIGVNVIFHDPASNVVGDTVVLKPLSQVYKVYNNQLLASIGAIFSQSITPLSLPVVNNLPTLPTINPGSTDITVPVNGSQTLSPGRYKNITLRTNSSLILTGGVYQFASLSLADQSRVVATAPVELRIAGRLVTGFNASIVPSANSGLDGRAIIIYVAGINSKNGKLSELPKAAYIGLNNTLTATLVVPNGTLWVDFGNTVHGALIAKDVIVGGGTKVWLENAFRPAVP
jgi:hypothetical protein